MPSASMSRERRKVYTLDVRARMTGSSLGRVQDVDVR